MPADGARRQSHRVFSPEITIPIRAIRAAQPLIALMHFAGLDLSQSLGLFEKGCNSFVRAVMVNGIRIPGTWK